MLISIVVVEQWPVFIRPLFCFLYFCCFFLVIIFPISALHKEFSFVSLYQILYYNIIYNPLIPSTHSQFCFSPSSSPTLPPVLSLILSPFLSLILASNLVSIPTLMPQACVYSYPYAPGLCLVRLSSFPLPTKNVLLSLK